MFVSPQNSYVEILTPNVTVLWNELKKPQLKLESVKVCRGSSHACHAWSFTTNRKRHMPTSQGGRGCLLYCLAGRRKCNSALRQPSPSDCSSSTNEKPPYFVLPASSSGLFGYYSPFQTTSPPHKKTIPY